MTAALAVSILALLFTIASFWYLQARRGRLVMSSIPAFAGYIAKDELAIRIPILLYNSGARTRLVDEIRLVFTSWADGHGEWETFHPTLKPVTGNGNTDDFAGPYPIDGRRAVMRFVKFTYRLADHLPEPIPTHCHVEARLDGSLTWRKVGAFTLYLEHMAHPANYITYRNSAVPCDGEPGSTRSVWRDLAVARGLSAPWAE